MESSADRVAIFHLRRWKYFDSFHYLCSWTYIFSWLMLLLFLSDWTRIWLAHLEDNLIAKVLDQFAVNCTLISFEFRSTAQVACALETSRKRCKLRFSFVVHLSFIQLWEFWIKVFYIVFQSSVDKNRFMITYPSNKRRRRSALWALARHGEL